MKPSLHFQLKLHFTSIEVPPWALQAGQGKACLQPAVQPRLSCLLSRGAPPFPEWMSHLASIWQAIYKVYVWKVAPTCPLPLVSPGLAGLTPWPPAREAPAHWPPTLHPHSIGPRPPLLILL